MDRPVFSLFSGRFVLKIRSHRPVSRQRLDDFSKKDRFTVQFTLGFKLKVWYNEISNAGGASMKPIVLDSLVEEIEEVLSLGKEVMLIGQNCHGLSALMHIPVWCPYGV